MRTPSRWPLVVALALFAIGCPEPKDTVPPAAPVLAAGALTDNSVALQWTAAGDDGTTGTAASYELRYRQGSGCPVIDANFDSGTLVPDVAAPQAAGAAEQKMVTGLSSGTTYCFALRVKDEAGNSALSASLEVTTPDTVPPQAPTIATGAISPISVEIAWTATGQGEPNNQVAAHALTYREGSACPITAANFSSSTLVPALPAPATSGTPQSVVVVGLNQETDYCFMLQVSDAAGNAAYSNEITATTPDGTAPAQPVMTAVPNSSTSVTLHWTAVGDDGNTGTATAYELRYSTSCPLAQGAGTLVPGLP